MLSKFYQVNLQEKIPLGRPRRRWEDNIRMDLEEIGINAGNWVGSAHYMELVNNFSIVQFIVLVRLRGPPELGGPGARHRLAFR